MAVVWTAGGATCHRKSALNELGRPPMILAETPPLEEIIVAVNRGDRVTKMQSPSATVELVDGGMGVPRLSATLAVDRPNRIRVRAKMPVVMAEGLDVGSNDDVFWMRYPEGMQKTLLYARHDAFGKVMMGSPLPINPKWLIEALGLVHLETQQVIEGPKRREDGNYEIRVATPTQSGTYHRVLDIDARGGFVRNQSVFGPDGRLVAQALGDDFRFYEDPGVVLPHSIFLYIQPSTSPAIRLRIEVGKYVLNQLLGADPRLFEMPADGNHHVVDLSRIGPPAGFGPSSNAPLVPIGSSPGEGFSSAEGWGGPGLSNQVGPAATSGGGANLQSPVAAGASSQDEGAGGLEPLGLSAGRSRSGPVSAGESVARERSFGVNPDASAPYFLGPRGTQVAEVPTTRLPEGVRMPGESRGTPGVPPAESPRSQALVPEATPWSPEGASEDRPAEIREPSAPHGQLEPIRDYVKVGRYGPALRGTQMR